MASVRPAFFPHTFCAGRSPKALSAVGQFPRAGFETEMTVPGTLHYLAVQALGSAGQVLGSSSAVLR